MFGLKRALEKAHRDGLADGAMCGPRDPAVRGAEVGWSQYLRWAYDAGYWEARHKIDRLSADLAEHCPSLTLEEAAQVLAHTARVR